MVIIREYPATNQVILLLPTQYFTCFDALQLWMGTHSLGPSRILRQDGTEEDLGTWLSQNDGVIIVNDTNNDNNLPFLFKVISIQKTLSLQAHPDKVGNPEFQPDRELTNKQTWLVIFRR